MTASAFVSPVFKPSDCNGFRAAANTTPTSDFELGWRGRGKEFEEQLLVHLRDFALRGECQQFARHVHQRPQGSLRVIAHGGDELIEQTDAIEELADTNGPLT